MPRALRGRTNQNPVAATSFDKIIKAAREAYQKGNSDYSLDLFQEALALDLDAVEARKELRAVARKHAGAKTAPTALLKVAVPFCKTAVMSMLKKHDAVLATAEKVLARLPNHLPTLKRLGRAARACDLDRTAMWIFEDILSVAPADVDTLRELARLFYETDEKRASGYYERILAILPNDKEAHEGVRDLAARATMKRGVEGSAASGEKDSWKLMQKDTDSSKRLEFNTKMLKTREEFETAIAYATDQIRMKPDDPKKWIELGEIHMTARSYDKAEEAFLKACEIDTINPTLRFKVGDAKIKRMEARVAELLERAKGGDAKAAAEAKQADAERIAFALEDYMSRVRAHPTDLDLRYRYGEILYRAGRWKEAVAEFQHAVRNPKRQKAATARMADCFERLGNDDLAHSHLLKALEQFNTVDEDCKGILYRLGRLEEKQGNLAGAHAHFMRIFEVDINYRDVSERVEKTRTKGAG